MIKFGPSGFCEEFSIANKSTEEMPKWLLNHNLKCYELSFTNGVRLSLETAEKYGKLFSAANIEVSVHAPYYINFANPDPLMIEKSNGYIIESLKRMEKLGAKKLVFHPGTQMKMTRDEAFNNTYNNIKNLITVLDEQGFKNYILCPETMGKFLGLLKRGLSDAIKITGAPFSDVKQVEFDPPQTSMYNQSNEVEAASSGATSRLIYASDKQSATEIVYSANIDEMIAKLKQAINEA